MHGQAISPGARVEIAGVLLPPLLSARELEAAADEVALAAHCCPARRGHPVPCPDDRLAMIFDLSTPERSDVVRARL